MPNWVATKLKFVDITDSEFKKIVDQYCTMDEYGHANLDFEKLIPMPDTVFRGPLSSQDMREHPGDLNWYDWSCNHWELSGMLAKATSMKTSMRSDTKQRGLTRNRRLRCWLKNQGANRSHCDERRYRLWSGMADVLV